MRLLHLALLGIEPGSLGLEPYFTMSARQGGSSFEVSVNHFAASSFSSDPVFFASFVHYRFTLSRPSCWTGAFDVIAQRICPLGLQSKTHFILLLLFF